MEESVHLHSRTKSCCRSGYLEIDCVALDLVLLAQIQSHLHCGEETVRTKKASQTARKRYRLDYFYEGLKICWDTFMYMHAVFKDRLAALIKHYLQNGVTPRIHGNKGRLPKHALEVDDIKRVVTFIHNYDEENAVLLPGRIPGYKRDDLKLLPSSISKVAIHKLFNDSCETSGHRALSERTFYHLWRQYVPNVLPMKPMSDLCWTCQKNSDLLLKAPKKDLDEKTEAFGKAEEHLLQATTERSFYNTKVQQCRRVVAENGVTKLLDPGNSAPNSLSAFEVIYCPMHGKHQSITLSFMLAGHTKFAPDAMFGLFKRKYRNSKVDCLADIENVVRKASPSGVLIPQLCGDEAGNVIVPMFGWDTYLLQFFRKLPSIKSLHHIDCRADGTVMCKTLSESEPVTHKLLKCNLADVPCEKPATLKPEGLREERKKYLFHDIREFVAENYRDLVCPDPNMQMENAVHAEVVTPAPPPTHGVGRPKKTPRALAKRIKLA
ncbi:hypothetical protein PO909_003653 [Leuciscus waleckii]